MCRARLVSTLQPGRNHRAYTANVKETERREAMVSGFKAFLLRGNVVDLAIAVVIGIAFGAVVTPS